MKRNTATELQQMVPGEGGGPVSMTSLRHHLTRGRFKPDADKRYNTEAVLEYIRAARLGDKKNGTPATQRKRELECELLQTRIDQLRGELVPRREMQETLLRHAAIVKRTVDNFDKDLAALCPDASAVKALKSKTDEMLRWLSAECEKGGL